jgi:tetratricopeptide (TPR) repeat protein
MRIFLSYASEDKAVAESITFALRSRGHNVFLDRDDLPAGQSHHEQIEQAINESDAMIFLISPDSVAQKKYTLSELALARRKWPSPSGHLLPVMVRKTPLEQIPPYLKAVIILEPQGDIASEISTAMSNLRAKGPAKTVGFVLCAAIVAIGGLIGIVIYSQEQPVGPPEDVARLQLHAVDLIDQGDFDQARAELDSAEKALDRITTGL